MKTIPLLILLCVLPYNSWSGTVDDERCQQLTTISVQWSANLAAAGESAHSLGRVDEYFRRKLEALPVPPPELMDCIKRGVCRVMDVQKAVKKVCAGVQK